MKRKAQSHANKKIQQAIQKRMQDAAGYLNKKVNRLPPKTLKTALLLCVSFAALANLTLIIHAVQSTNVIPALNMEPVTLPQTVPPAEKAIRDTLPDAAAYHRIHRFRQFLDNLKASPKGKVLYDSITHNRPGLEDSIVLFLKYYSPK